MSFQEELKKLVLEIYFTGFQVGQYTQPSDETLEKRLNDSLTSIINLVDKELPEKKPNALKPGGIVLSEDGKTVAISNLQSASSGGYNQALTDMRNKLRDGE